jgi:hypothetical protein
MGKWQRMTIWLEKLQEVCQRYNEARINKIKV